MDYVKSVGSFIRRTYNNINPATLSGAIDIIVCEHEDEMVTSPFHVRFGKLGVLSPKEKVVNISVNGNRIDDIQMKLGEQGEAFFVTETQKDETVPFGYVTSPMPTSPINSRPSTPNKAEVDSRRHRKKKYQRRSLSTPDEPRSLSSKDSISDSESGDLGDLEFDPELRQAGASSQASSSSSHQDDEECYDYNLSRVQSSAHFFTPRQSVQPTDQIDIDQLDNTVTGDGASLSSADMNDDSIINEDISEDTFEDTFPDDLLDRFAAPDDLCERLNKLNYKVKPGTPRSIRRASLGAPLEDLNESNTPTMVWPYGELPHIVTEGDDLPSTEIRDIVLDRVMQSSPIIPDVTPSKQIRRRRRFDSEPPLAADRAILDPLSPLSPLSDAVDSGTDCWEDVENELAISLGGALMDNNQISDISSFKQRRVSFADFNADPKKYIGNPSLIIRMGNKYYNWHAASAIFMSMIVFNKPIDDSKIKQLQNETIFRKRSSWFPWGRTMSHSESPLAHSNLSDLKESASPTHHDTLLDIPGMSLKIPESSTPEKQKDIGLSRSYSVGQTDPFSYRVDPYDYSHMKKTLILSSDDLKKLNLKYGENEICFWLTTMFQDKIVVSDIDGTITRSDVMGYIFPTIGKDWSQEGVTKLYKRINDNGYRFIFLSSRAICQASMTKSYLEWVRQDGIPLPRGAVMLNPTSLFNAFHKEVIARAPEEFKICCLQGIKKIFPDQVNPFWAGFGNRLTDVKSYREVGMADKRIYIVNHLGHLKDQQERLKNYTTSYSELGTKCDHFFPVVEDVSRLCNEKITNEIQSHNYWKLDLPVVDFNGLV